ncbi:energy-coupling factor ABC transporter ATP-binding protein [Pelistega europaea]|uniref:Energy-coupling factor ABC transporter ATP-binding protein n=1 Tax=Pelistega europaea TaxID=106147 RepID=A0A7Y4P797_9BURK|nr:energy-coupling factor ABC transporter ATP-binding protein [Pelistega europaea]NOL50520.1 energy-coupling factor ABC transporter ATP-binding protein [Pelistega europaea]
MTVLDVRQLSIHYHQHPVIHQLSFTLDEQQCLCLRGEIGSGKTTLLLSLLGFVPITTGSIYWFGNPYKKEQDFVTLRGSKVGICFQNASEQLFGPTVLDDVAFGPLNQGLAKEQAYQIAHEQLARLGIATLQNRSVNTLSGGEQNFTAIAGALAMKPDVLLLDEPTNGLDSRNRDKLMQLLKELQLPLLITSHDEYFIKKMADDYISLKRLDYPDTDNRV